jgi:hypothetical protein
VLAGLALANASCSSGHASTEPISAVAIGDGAVRYALAPAIGGLGLQIQRLSVEKTTGPDPQLELSLYVRPPKPMSPDAYAAHLAPLARAVIPASFAKYHDIEWVDVCQERAGTPDGVEGAVPMTRLEVNRKDAATVDWKHFGLPQVIQLYRRSSNRVSLETNDGVDRTWTWRAALAQSRPPA